MKPLNKSKCLLLVAAISGILGCQKPYQEVVRRLEALSQTKWPAQSGRELVFLSPTTGCGSCLESGKEFLYLNLGHKRLKAVIVAPSEKIGQLEWGTTLISNPSVKLLFDPTEYTQELTNGGFALFFFENGQCIHYEAATPNTAAQLLNRAQRFLEEERMSE